MNELKKNSFIYLGFFLFIIIALLVSIVNISRNFLPQNSASTQLKSMSEEVEKVIKTEFSNLPSRFTRFNYIQKERFFNSPGDYENFYRKFSSESIGLINSSLPMLEKIEQELETSGKLPVLYDSTSKGLYIPLFYFEAGNITELKQRFKTTFNNRFLSSENTFTTTEVSNYLNYIFFKAGDKKTLVLVSAPKDPDPLFSDNKREFIVFCYENKRNYTFKTFGISN